MLQVLVRLNASILWPFVVDGPRGIKERHIAILASTKIDFLQLEFVSRVKVLFWIPQYSAIKDLTWKDREAFIRSDFKIREKEM